MIMDVFGESLLEREGAHAAAQGQSWRANPFLLQQNMPQATGESLGDWSRRHDAWQRGFEGFFQLGPELARGRKDKLTADVLKTLVERRLQWLPAMRSYMTQHPRLRLRLPLRRRHERDLEGRDWDLEDFEHSMTGTTPVDAQLRAIVERLRRPYDILSCAEAAGVPDGMGPCPSGSAPLDAQGPVTSAPAGEGPAQASAVTDDQALRSALGIRRIGWRYEYRGYRYDRLAAAVAYARLNRDAPRSEAASTVARFADEPPQMPDEAQRRLMSQWAISFEAGVYSFRNYRYERLCDAVAYAQLCAARDGGGDDTDSRRTRQENAP
jgi:hypothetical protein